jgi:IS30 family transposase
VRRSRGIAAGLSARAIAALLGRPPSTVSREISRNGGRDAYRAAAADLAAWDRARRPKVSRLASHPELLHVVREKLELDWSPEKIANWLKQRHDGSAFRISHETIYRTVYVSGRSELGSHPARHLRSGRSVRHVRKAKQAHGRGVLRNMTSIGNGPQPSPNGLRWAIGKGIW